MKNTTQTNRRPLGYFGALPTKLLMGFVALAVVSAANLAIAQSAVQFEIAESSRLLEASLQLQRGQINQIEFDLVQQAETCKNPSARLQDRNRPWMLVQNTSTTPDDVTTVTIDLTEPGFEFGDGDVAGDGFDGLLSLLSFRSDSGVSLSSAVYASDSSELELNFTGLSAGSAAIFRIDLDEPAGVIVFPDYREAMLGANTGDGPGQRATITTAFGSGGSTVSKFASAGNLLTSGITEAYHGQTMSTVTPTETIPEPTTLVLLMASLTGLATLRRSR